MHISGDGCGEWGFHLQSNGTLTRQTNDNYMTLVNAFVHQSRIFYINNLFEIISDNGKFLTSLPNYFSKHFFWDLGDFISYDNFLLFVPLGEHLMLKPFDAVLISEDFFREYEIIRIFRAGSYFDIIDDALDQDKSVLMFQNELLAVKGFETKFYNDESWKDFEMEWGGLEVIHRNEYRIKFFVVYTPTGDLLFAFSGSAER